MNVKIEKEGLVLETDRLIVRPVTVADVTEEYVEGLNDPEVNRFLVAVRLSRQTRESVEASVRANLADPRGALFGIFVRDDPRPFVGTIRVHEIDGFHYTAVLGACLFARRALGRGYATEALRRVCRYLFDEVGLRYLEASAYTENVRSIELFLRAGFERRFLVTDKWRHEDSFKPVQYLGLVNPRFDAARLKGD